MKKRFFIASIYLLIFLLLFSVSGTFYYLKSKIQADTQIQQFSIIGDKDWSQSNIDEEKVKEIYQKAVREVNLEDFKGQSVDEVIAQAVDHQIFWIPLVTTFKEKASQANPDLSTLKKVSSYVGAKTGMRSGTPAINNFVYKHRGNLALVLAAISQYDFMFNYELAAKLDKAGIYKNVDPEKGITETDIYRMLDSIPVTNNIIDNGKMPFVVRYYALKKASDKINESPENQETNISLKKLLKFGLYKNNSFIKQVFAKVKNSKIITQNIHSQNYSKSLGFKLDDFFKDVSSFGEKMLEALGLKKRDTERARKSREIADLGMINMAKAAVVIEPTLSPHIVPNYSKTIQVFYNQKVSNPLLIAQAINNPNLFKLKLPRVTSGSGYPQNAFRIVSSSDINAEQIRYYFNSGQVNALDESLKGVDLSLSLESSYLSKPGLLLGENKDSAVFISKLKNFDRKIIGLAKTEFSSNKQNFEAYIIDPKMKKEIEKIEGKEIALFYNKNTGNVFVITADNQTLEKIEELEKQNQEEIDQHKQLLESSQEQELIYRYRQVTESQRELYTNQSVVEAFSSPNDISSSTSQLEEMRQEKIKLELERKKQEEIITQFTSEGDLNNPEVLEALSKIEKIDAELIPIDKFLIIQQDPLSPIGEIGTYVQVDSGHIQKSDIDLKNFFRFNPITGKPEIKIHNKFGADLWLSSDLKITGTFPLSAMLGSHSALSQMQFYFDSDGSLAIGSNITRDNIVIGGISVDRKGEISGSIDIAKALGYSKSFLILSVSSSGIEGASIPFGSLNGMPFSLGIDKNGHLSLTAFVSVSFLPIPIPIGLTTNSKGEPIISWPGGSWNIGKTFGLRSKDPRPRTKPTPLLLADGSLDFGSYWFMTCHRHITGKDCVWNEVRSDSAEEQFERAKTIYDTYTELTGCPPTEEDFFKLYFYTGAEGIATFEKDKPLLQKRTITKIISNRNNNCKSDTSSSLGYNCSIKSENAEKCKKETFDLKAFLEKIGGEFKGINLALAEETPRETSSSSPTEQTAEETPSQETNHETSQPSTSPDTDDLPDTNNSSSLTQNLMPQTPPRSSNTKQSPIPEEEQTGNVLSSISSFVKGPAFLPATGTALIGMIFLTLLITGLIYFSKWQIRKNKNTSYSNTFGNSQSNNNYQPPQTPNPPE